MNYYFFKDFQSLENGTTFAPHFQRYSKTAGTLFLFVCLFIVQCKQLLEGIVYLPVINVRKHTKYWIGALLFSLCTENF